ncbi:fimbrial protein [Escherichia coli]|uniref:fimbrial protein n=1 Tax=Escherichia coli TaxID=562 RepID=UPI000DE840A9|nr:type 1 fimbrial protein [Escherichia coli]RBQ41317.1 adhesin [Escherichia coli]
MKTKNKLIVAAVSALLLSGTAMAETFDSTINVTGTIGTPTCNVQLPSGDITVPNLSIADINGKSQWGKITTISAGNIVVKDCSDKTLKLTVTTPNSSTGKYVYPHFGGTNQQKDFAFYLGINNTGVSLNTPIDFANTDASYPVSLDMIKLSNNYNKSYAGTYSAQYTFNVTYN